MKHAALRILLLLSICQTMYSCAPPDKYIDGGGGKDPGGKIPVCISPAAEERSHIEKVFQLLNAYRAENKLPPLRYDKGLERAAQAHCLHMDGHSFFGHFAPEAKVKRPEMRAAFCEVIANGENLAVNAETPEQAMKFWKESIRPNAPIYQRG